MLDLPSLDTVRKSHQVYAAAGRPLLLSLMIWIGFSPVALSTEGPTSPGPRSTRHDRQGSWIGEQEGPRRSAVVVKLEADLADPHKVLAELAALGGLAEKAGGVSRGSAVPVFPRLKDPAKSRVSAAAVDRGLDRIFRFPGGAAPQALAERLSRDPRVSWAEPLFRVSTQVEEPEGSDPYLTSEDSWGHGLADLWGHHRIRAPEAWTVADGMGVLVAVIDSGCDFSHPDLQPNLWINHDEIDGNGVDDDGNGYVDDVRGWDFFGTWDPEAGVLVDDNLPEDQNGHGTHVSGTVAAVRDNGIGIAGLAPGAKVLCIQGLSLAGIGFSDDLAESIVYAAQQGAGVINMSWGGIGYSQLIEDALGVAYDLGSVLVAAAGNNYGETRDFHPASSRYVISVGASDPMDQRAVFSNFGTGLDLVAPGGGIPDNSDTATFVNMLSLRASVHAGPEVFEVGDAYLRLWGTSMAAPHVSGTAALLLQQRPDLTHEEVRQILRGSAAQGSQPGWQINTGYGRLDASAALDSDLRGSVRLLSPRPLTFIEDRIEIRGIAQADQLVSYVLEVGGSELPSSWTSLLDGEGSVQDLRFSWDVSEVPDGDYTLRLRAQDSAGRTYEDRVTVVLDRVELLSPEEDLPAFRVGDVLSIRGRASGGGFQRFRVEFQDHNGDWRQDGMALSAGGSEPVAEGDLATWDTSVLQDRAIGELYPLRLVVERAGAEPIQEQLTVIVDPKRRAGWPFRLNFDSGGSFQLGFFDHLVAEDLDADGTLETLVAFEKEVYALRHDGSLVPGWPRNIDESLPVDVFVQKSPLPVDLDGDGDLEVVMPAVQSWAAAWHHDGTAVAGWPKRIGATVSAADLDGDGRPELVGVFDVFSGRSVEVFNTDGSPHLAEPVIVDEAIEDMARPAIGDLDGDGRPEMVFQVFTDDGNQLYAFEHDGTPIDGWPVGVGSTTFQQTYPAMGDVDGDGVLEAVAVDLVSCRVVVVDARGRMLPGWPQRATADAAWCSSPVVGDLDGDLRSEVVVGGSETRLEEELHLLAAWHGDGQAVTGFPVEIRNPRDGAFLPGFATPALADLDGDEEADIVVGVLNPSDEGRFAVVEARNLYAFNRRGEVKAGFPLATSGAHGSYLHTPLVADLDGNGKVELAWANHRGDVAVWNMDAKPPSPAASWPMFRHDAGLRGSAGGTGPCVPSPSVLCLGDDDRFEVRVLWRDFDGLEGKGRSLGLTRDTGVFWFFEPENLELMVKILDGRQLNGHFWVFFGALSNVEYELIVTDTQTGRRWRTVNPAGNLSSGSDTRALPDSQQSGSGAVRSFQADPTKGMKLPG